MINSLQNETIYDTNILFKNIDSAIYNMNIGIGRDMVHSNHLKYSGTLFRSFIRRLFNRFISHGFIQRQMLSGEFRPIVNNRSEF